MNRHGMDRTPAGLVLGALALGALAMYLLDPEQGNRRRALVKDKLYSISRKSRKRAEAKSRDLVNRARGVAHEARRVAGKLGLARGGEAHGESGMAGRH